MKELIRKISYPFILLLLLTGCKAPVAQQSGKEDIAYLLFISPDKYAGEEVTVTIDGQSVFQAKVVKEKKAKRHGTQYGIKTGPRKIKVTHEGQVIYQKQLFISTQEVKQIILP